MLVSSLDPNQNRWLNGLRIRLVYLVTLNCARILKIPQYFSKKYNAQILKHVAGCMCIFHRSYTGGILPHPELRLVDSLYTALALLLGIWGQRRGETLTVSIWNFCSIMPPSKCFEFLPLSRCIFDYYYLDWRNFEVLNSRVIEEVSHGTRLTKKRKRCPIVVEGMFYNTIWEKRNWSTRYHDVLYTVKPSSAP